MPRKRKEDTLEAQAAQTFRMIRFTPIDERDPMRYLESRRREYLERLELIADEARANGNPELELKALAFGIRLTSMFKTKVDVSASNLGLIKAPDLNALGDEQLKQIENATELDGELIKEH